MFAVHGVLELKTLLRTSFLYKLTVATGRRISHGLADDLIVLDVVSCFNQADIIIF